MAKYFVTVSTSSKRYKLCRDDIQKFYAFKTRKVPRLPAYDSAKKEQEEDRVTNYSDL